MRREAPVIAIPKIHRRAAYSRHRAARGDVETPSLRHHHWSRTWPWVRAGRPRRGRGGGELAQAWRLCTAGAGRLSAINRVFFRW